MVQVSVPYRGLIFLNNVWRTKRKLHLWFPSPTGDLYFSMLIKFQLFRVKRFRPLPGTYISQLKMGKQSKFRVWFPSPTGDLYFSIPSPQFLVNTDCITQFAWEMIFQKYKFIFHYKKLSKCLFYAVRGKTNIF